MAILFRNNSSYGYAKMEKEDPEERKRREAQFLIYKTLKQADELVVKRSPSRRPSWLRLRFCRLKVKIGKRLMRLRKSMLSSIMAKSTKSGVCKHVMGQLKSLKRLFSQGSGGCGGGRSGGAANIGRLPQPLFATT